MASIEVAKRTMGFKYGSLADSCSTCRNRETRQHYGRTGLHCTLGGFMVPPSAVCAKHESDRRHQPEGQQA